jgi:hypothetical protein
MPMKASHIQTGLDSQSANRNADMVSIPGYL